MKVVDKNAYFKRIGYTPFPEQVLYHNSTARFRTSNCGRRFGKAGPVQTPLLTPNGWTTIGAIRVGEFVYGPDGEPTRVVAKSEVMYGRTCYRVVFDDDSEGVADADHQWAVETYTMRKSRNNGRWSVPAYKIMTTEQLRERADRVKYPDSIMLTQPVQMPVQKLDIDPYVFGVWLGDGTAGERHITCHDDDAPTYQEHFEQAGFPLRKKAAKYVWHVENFPRQMRKSVPDEYRLGSVEQRLALLQGLMDTDGTVSNEQLQFDNTNEELVDVVEWLVNSLGGKGRRYSHVGKYKDASTGSEYKECKTSYRFGFNIALPAFRLQRKLDKQMRLKQGPMTVRRYIKKVELVESMPVQCIQVEREDGLFLWTTSLIVTHNSTMAGRDIQPKLLLPNKNFWIVGPTYDLGEKEFRVIWQDMIVGQKLGQDKTIQRAYNKRSGNMFIKFPWNTLLEVRSADKPENLVGEALDGVIMSEAAKHKKETWEKYIRPALADRRGFADFPTTPEGFNWYYDLWMLGQDKTLPEYASWRFPSWANSAIYPGGEQDLEIKLLRRTMSKANFEQEIAADFGSFEGKIYGDWDATENVRNVEFNPAWPNYMAIDWGYTNPLAAIEFQVSPDDRVYIWREHYKPYMRVEDHLREMQERDQPVGYHLDMIFADAADPEAVMTVNEKFGPCIALPEAKVNWRQGIDLVGGFLEREEGEDEFGGPIYKRALFVDFKCVNVIREFNNYKAPSSVNGKNVTEMGLRADDHAMDAIRYGLVHLFTLGAHSHLSDVYSLTSGANASAVEMQKTMGSNDGLTESSSLDAGYFTSVGSF